MYARNCTKYDLELALKAVNEEYGNNITWNQEPDWRGSRLIFTLKVKDSHRDKPGTRESFSGRRVISACWHVHGDFFDALLEINPDTIIESRGGKIYMTNDEEILGNWEDFSCGNYYQPTYASQLCNNC